MKTLIRGFLYGSAFFIAGFYAFQYQEDWKTYLQASAELPVIRELSKDFKTGIEVFGRDFDSLKKQLDAKITPDWQASLQNNNIAWQRQQIERKLAHFRGSKQKQSIAYLNYIEQYAGMALAEMAHYQIPASVKLAQGLLETNAGDSHIARAANNHFGIKCRKRPNYKADGKITYQDFYPATIAYGCLQMHDDHVWDRFNMYDSPTRSYRHHSQLITESSRYNWMIRQYRDKVGAHCQVEPHWFGTDTVPYYAAWCIGLKKSGYATSERYAQKLTYIIQTYELWRFDYQLIQAYLNA